MIKSSKEFALKQHELDYIGSVLEGEYDPSGIVLIHSGILVSPRLIAIDVLPGPKEVNIMDPAFRMNTLHIMTTTRIIGLSQMGLMYFYVLGEYGISSWADVNLILLAIQEAHRTSQGSSMSLWISSLVDLKESPTNEVFADEPMFTDTMNEEVDFCDKIMAKAFDTNLLNESMKPKQVTTKMNLQSFLEMFGELLGGDKDGEVDDDDDLPYYGDDSDDD